MKKLRKVLLSILIVIVALVLVVLGVRLVNGLLHPAPPELASNPQDASSYPTTITDGTVERLEGTYLNGFHLAPQTKKHDGLVVVWGGSDGSPDFRRGARLAGQGYDVLSLFYFGQPNQQPVLADVPLDFFDEVLAWRAEHAPTGPLTVIGTSKGAELALALQAHYPEIDNVVVYTPTTHVWQGLDFTTERSSWTWRGQPLPHVSFQHADPGTFAHMLGGMLLNYPIRLNEQYMTALANDPDRDAAAIPLALPGHLIAFAGDDDAMWPAADAARHWGAAAPGRTEAHIYPEAGHMFGPFDGWAGGYAMGGSRAANMAAQTASDEVLDAALAAWHTTR